MGSKRRNNPFWLLTTSNQTRSSCVYLQNKTNKQKPCPFAGSWGKRWHLPWEKKGCQEGQEGFIVTGTPDIDLGRTPAYLTDIWAWLFNKHGAEFQSSSVYLG